MQSNLLSLKPCSKDWQADLPCPCQPVRHTSDPAVQVLPVHENPKDKLDHVGLLGGALIRPDLWSLAELSHKVIVCCQSRCAIGQVAPVELFAEGLLQPKIFLEKFCLSDLWRLLDPLQDLVLWAFFLGVRSATKIGTRRIHLEFLRIF